jgi:Ni/Co efflux regulator RcnB
VNKIVLALATVATIGLTTAAFAGTTPSMKDVRPAHAQASVTHKKTVSHRVGAKKVAVAYKHPVYRHGAHVARYSHYTGKKHCAKHVTAKRTVRTKTSAA